MFFRSFSIASSQKSTPDKIQLLVAVVRYRSNLVDPRLGLCSNYLANASIGTEIPIWVKKGTLKFPNEPTLPYILVGPGTGVAPFRSLILNELTSGSKRPIYLIFGCRSRLSDYYFQSEWEKLRQDFPNFKVLTAFSRDQEDKYYVQHVIQDNKQLFGNLLVNEDAFIYIAGNSKNMPDQVQDAFKEAILTQDDEGDENEAKKFIEQLIKDKRLQMETWS